MTTEDILSESSNCPLKTGLRPCQCHLPRCPVCNYTKHDAQFEMDHSACSGTIPEKFDYDGDGRDGLTPSEFEG